MIRMFDHTADVGFEIEAPALSQLFEEARAALLMTVFERPPERGGQERRIRLSAPDLETLMVRWINELVYLIQIASFTPIHSQIEAQGTGEESCELEARLAGCEPDLEAHGWQGEIKSATFHGLSVERVGKLWRAQIILDV